MDRLGGEHAVLAVALDAVHGLIGQRHQAVERPDAQVRGGDAEAGAERKHFVGTQDVIAAQCAAQPLGDEQRFATNSSPPHRPRWSDGRRASAQTSATSRITSSPTRCP